jgi:hypothetical protein
MAKEDTERTPVGTIAEVPGDPVTAEQLREAQVKEYGQYVALGPIDHDGARAYNAGDPVPTSNVDRWDYHGRGLVAKRGTKDANAAVEQANQPPGLA